MAAKTGAQALRVAAGATVPEPSPSPVAPRQTKAGAQGFTLVEALVSAAIGAVIFTALYAGISNSFSLLNVARANLRATQIMVSRLEGLRLCAWGTTNQMSQLFNTNIIPPTFTDYFYPQGMHGDTNCHGAIYQGTMTIETNITLDPPASYSPGMARVTVTLTWTDGIAGQPVTHTRKMSTFVAQFGEQNYVFNH
jgi:prepilin-type N-terminal cleavage/methylation domain-containing protein